MHHTSAIDFKASPERLDSSEGYVVGNVVWIIGELNTSRPWSLDKIAYWISNRCRLSQLMNQAQSIIAALNQYEWDKAHPPPPRAVKSYIWRGIIDGVYYIGCNRCKQVKLADEFTGEGIRGCFECVRKAYEEKCTTLLGCLSNLHSSAQAHARDREGERSKCTITVDDLRDIYRRQYGLCYWSGLPLVIAAGKHIPWIASVERLNVHLGYIPGNCALICLEFNSPDDLVRIKTSNGGSAGWSTNKIDVVWKSINSRLDENPTVGPTLDADVDVFSLATLDAQIASAADNCIEVGLVRVEAPPVNPRVAAPKVAPKHALIEPRNVHEVLAQGIEMRKSIQDTSQTSAGDDLICLNELIDWDTIPRPTQADLEDPESIYYDVRKGPRGYQNKRALIQKALKARVTIKQDQLESRPKPTDPHRLTPQGVCFNLVRYANSNDIGLDLLKQVQYDLFSTTGFRVNIDFVGASIAKVLVTLRYSGKPRKKPTPPAEPTIEIAAAGRKRAAADELPPRPAPVQVA
jgi:hypothetical protein